MSHSIRMAIAISVTLMSGAAVAQPNDESAVPPPRPIALVKSVGTAIEGRAGRSSHPRRVSEDLYRAGLPVVLGADCPPDRSARDDYEDEADYGPLGSVDVPHKERLA